MKKLTPAIALPLAALAVIGSGLTIGAALPDRAAPAPSPAIAPHSLDTLGVGTPTPPPCQEDEPCWNCIDMGNRICGDPDGERATPAWEAFDTQGGARKLKVDPSRPFRVDYVGYAVETPRLTGDQLGIVGIDGIWYIFEAGY